MLQLTIAGTRTKVDPDRLTPHARALAEAIAEAGDTVDIWMEADAPIRDTTPGWEVWFTEAEAALPERRPWRGWSNTPLGRADPHMRLEREAAKVPPGWHVLGAHPRQDPKPAVREVTSAQVLDYLRKHGRDITPATWRSYVSRGQAPKPSKWVGRTPIWYLDDIEAWVNDPARRA